MGENKINMTNFVEKGCIHYSKERDSFYIGYYGGLGNFDVRTLPKAQNEQLRGLLQNKAILTENKPFTAPCVGIFLREENDDFKGYWVKLDKVRFV